MVLATGRIPNRVRYYVLTFELVRFHSESLPLWERDADDRRYPVPPANHKHSIEDAVVIVLTGLSVSAFAYYRSLNQWQHGWKKQDSPIIDPNCSGEDQSMTLHSGIWLRGKLYALSLQGTLVVIERESSVGAGSFRVGSMGEQRMVPCAQCNHFREIMVESGGEVLLVFFVFRKSIDFVDGLEVYRLRTGELEWVRMYDLGDRVLFFMNNCCVSVSVAEAEGLGYRRNRLYFKHVYSTGWSDYDMTTGTINRHVEFNLLN